MEYRTLGSSGAVVSTLALGTMTFGNETDEAGSHAQLDALRRRRAGPSSTPRTSTRAGRSEAIIGRWLSKASPGSPRPGRPRHQGTLPDGGRDPTTSGRRAGTFAGRSTTSLERLGVDHIDLYQLHAWDPVTPLEETLAFLDDAVRAGKVGYAGLSNFTGWQVQKACDLVDRRGWAPLVTLQPQYNLLVREIEWEIVPACQENGLGLLPWSPLGGGWLTGKYKRDVTPDRRDPARREPGPWRGVVLPALGPDPDLGRRRRRSSRSRTAEA